VLQVLEAVASAAVYAVAVQCSAGAVVLSAVVQLWDCVGDVLRLGTFVALSCESCSLSGDVLPRLDMFLS
jgi:hypothetical protein